MCHSGHTVATPKLVKKNPTRHQFLLLKTIHKSSEGFIQSKGSEGDVSSFKAVWNKIFL